MASKRSGSKGGAARSGSGKARMESLKDLKARDSAKVKAGGKAVSKSGRADFSNLTIMKVVDKSSVL